MLPNLSRDRRPTSWTAACAFLPELMLCGAIVLLLLLRLFRVCDRLAPRLGRPGPDAGRPGRRRLPVGRLRRLGRAGSHRPYRRARCSAACSSTTTSPSSCACFLLGFTALMIWLTLLTGIPDREDSADFYCLLLGATLGMMLMASANHLLMVFIGVEMASLPSYALAGFLKGRRQSSEAALKYVVYGGGAVGRHALRHQPAGRQVRHRLPARPGRRLTSRPSSRRHGARPDADPGHAVHPDRHRLQAGGGAVPLLVPRRVRGGVGRGGRLPVGGVQGGGPGAAGPARPRLRRRRSAGRPADGNWMAVLRYLVPALAFFAGRDGDVRQPGRLPADQPQAAAGLLDHRPRRLHDDGPGDADARRRRRRCCSTWSPTCS